MRIRSFETAVPTRQSGLTFFDVAICLYLAAPVLVFCLWFKPPFAILLAILSGASMTQALAGARWRELELRPRFLLLLAAIALVWVALGGGGHFFFANHDWLTRDAVLRDLALTGWPPSYPTANAAPLILRAPIGYYLPASLVGKAWGLNAADLALYVWTSVGFFLTLAGAVRLFVKPFQRTICLLLLLLFGGMDLPGHVMFWRAIPEWGQHLEWWSGFAQYSSNSTLLFWVPNHAIPAWLTTLLILRHWRMPELARIAPLLGSCVPFWSPLAALGSVPFFLVGIDWRRHAWTLLSMRRFLPSALVALVCARYLTMGAAHIPGGWLFDGTERGDAFANVYAVFCLLEFGILSLVLLRLRAFGLAQAVAALILCLLPLYRFGYGNDFVMRASIPALLVLALASVDALTKPGNPLWRGVLAAVLMIGAAGASQEPVRALLLQTWKPTGMTLQEVSERVTPEKGEAALPHTYVTHLQDAGAARVLRTPSRVSSSQPGPRAPQRRAIEGADIGSRDLNSAQPATPGSEP